MKPEVLAEEIVFEGKIFDILTARIREKDVEYQREIVLHKGSVVVVPVFEDLTVALVRQYRRAAREYLLEIPAGLLEMDESHEAGARRELEEEVGVIAGKIEKLTEFYVSPGFLSEKIFMFLATELTETAQNLESDELLTVERISFDEAFAKIRNGEIQDAKTIIGLILAGAKFGFVYKS